MKRQFLTLEITGHAGSAKQHEMNITETELREFLLRRMSAADCARVEEAILVEDGVAERLRAEELDLIDDYAAGRLSGEDRADVERHLLISVENINSLRTSRLLQSERALREAPRAALKRERTRVIVKPARVVRASRWTVRVTGARSLLAAGLVAGLVPVLLIGYWREPRSRVTTPPPVAASAVSQSTPSRPAIAAADPLPILTLLAEVNRGSAQPSLHWTAGATAVRLQAEVTSPQEALYTLRVSDAAGHRLFEVAALPEHSAGPYRFVDTVVPSAALGPGARIISLLRSGAAEGAPADYTWHVVGVLD